mgnify:CR=1 FL=1
MNIIAIVLTFNEELHIARCLENCSQFADKLVVVDSVSTDDTKKIALEFRAVFMSRTFDNQARQFNWALQKIDANQNDLIVRIDADEILDYDAIQSILALKEGVSAGTSGWSFNRKIKFQGEIVKFGGLDKKYITRAFLYGHGKSNLRLMDEHIEVDGKVEKLPGLLIDDNKNDLRWWLEKHVSYAEREALASLESNQIAGGSIQHRIYNYLPRNFRPLLYFLYRFFLRGGVFSGTRGRQFHYLQGYVYRKLVEEFISNFKYQPPAHLKKIGKKYGK